jgi:hypothetical protein
VVDGGHLCRCRREKRHGHCLSVRPTGNGDRVGADPTCVTGHTQPPPRGAWIEDPASISGRNVRWRATRRLRTSGRGKSGSRPSTIQAWSYATDLESIQPTWAASARRPRGACHRDQFNHGPDQGRGQTGDPAPTGSPMAGNAIPAL